MNVREWIAQHSKQVPEALTERVIAMLGAEAAAPAQHAGDACLKAATRSLNDLLASGRYERASALDLLAIDALTTFAYEHASQNGMDAATLKSFANSGAKALSSIPRGNG